eukprot:7198555-Alexandrium_andersonii.AAC.1
MRRASSSRVSIVRYSACPPVQGPASTKMAMGGWNNGASALNALELPSIAELDDDLASQPR